MSDNNKKTIIATVLKAIKNHFPDGINGIFRFRSADFNQPYFATPSQVIVPAESEDGKGEAVEISQDILKAALVAANQKDDSAAEQVYSMLVRQYEVKSGSETSDKFDAADERSMRSRDSGMGIH